MAQEARRKKSLFKSKVCSFGSFLLIRHDNCSSHCIHPFSNFNVTQLCDADTPGEPVGPIVFSNISEGICTLSWSPPENDGCSEISHYIVEKRETSKISWALVSDECHECTFNATKLIKTNEYQFRVSAVNKFGVGRPLESSPVIAQLQYSKSQVENHVIQPYRQNKLQFLLTCVLVI